MEVRAQLGNAYIGAEYTDVIADVKAAYDQVRPFEDHPDTRLARRASRLKPVKVRRYRAMEPVTCVIDPS